MSDIQITISEQENISLEISSTSDSVAAYNQPVVPAIEVVTGGTVTNVYEGGGGAQVLNDLTDVNAGSGANQGEILFYNVNAGEWQKGDYDDIAGIPTLSAVATSGSYNDLTDVPQGDDFSGDYNDLTNLPTLFDGDYNSLTNTPSIPSSLNDLSDVDFSTISPAHGQVLKYDSQAGTFKPADDEVTEIGDGGGGGTIDELNDVGDVSTATAANYDFLMYNGADWVNALPKIDESITVSNTDGALGNAVGKTYTAGTNIITILQDILTDYYPTEITLTSLKVQYQGTDGTYGSTTTTTGTTREVGQGVKVVGFNFTIGDNTQTEDNSVEFQTSSGTTIESGLSDSSFSPNLQAGNVQTVDPTSVSTSVSSSYRVTVNDNGSGTDNTRTSGDRTITHRWLYKMFATTTSAVNDNSAAQTLYDSTAEVSSLATNNTKTITCTANNNTGTNYTWIVYPASWTQITSILQDGSLSVLSAFQSPVTRTITNQYGVSKDYYFYRSNDPGAFAEDVELQVSF